MTTRRTVLVSAMVLCLIGVFAAYAFFKSDSQLDKVKELAQQFTPEQMRNMPAEQRREAVGQFQEEMKKLSPAQRQQLMQEGRKRAQEEMNRFFAMPSEEKRNYLDKRIDDMESMRKDLETRMEQRAANSQQTGNNPPRQRRSLSDEERHERFATRLNNSTAEERAQRAEFRNLLNQRLQERGLPPFPFPGRRM